MRIFALLAVLFILSAPVRAQDALPPLPDAPTAPAAPALAPGAEGEVVAEPICFNVVNKAPYAVIGTIATNVYTTPEGIEARHRANFRLGPDEQTNFCSQGPFYAGRQLDFNIHSLIPLFSCRTAITGDIVINGRKKEEGGTETWAACLK